MEQHNTKFIELDFIDDMEKEKAYQALVNINHIVDIWTNTHGFAEIRVSAGNYTEEYSTLNTYEEVKELINKGEKNG